MTIKKFSCLIPCTNKDLNAEHLNMDLKEYTDIQVDEDDDFQLVFNVRIDDDI